MLNHRRAANGALWAVAVALLTSAAPADTIYVDDDNCPGPGSGTEGDPYCSIQIAIEAASETDELVVAPGTYLETINLLGKAITVRSSAGPDGTTIDAQGAGPVVTCNGGEGPDTVLEGFTITGGSGIDPGTGQPVGGGMYVEGGNPTVIGCTFRANDAYWGAGMANDQGSPTVTACTFDLNVAWLGGGAMYNVNGSNATLTNCAFTGNQAINQAGGAIRSDSTSHLIVESCTFEDNVGLGAGGISSLAGNLTTVTNCTFRRNNGSGVGSGALTVTGCTFEEHQFAVSGGSAGALMTLIGCEFTNNEVAVTSWFDANLVISGCTFAGSSLAIQGSHGTATVVDCQFDNNGTAVASGSSASLTVENCAIRNCTDRALSIHNDTATVANTTFANNNLVLYSYDPVTKVSFVNCQIMSSQEVFRFIRSGSLVRATNCTFYNNADLVYVHTSPSSVQVRNSVIWATSVDADHVDIAWSDLEVPLPGGGQGNISLDPLFVDPDGGDLRLLPDSPCIDAGHNWAIAGLADADLDGNPRFAADEADFDPGCGIPVVVDMGAYEYQGEPFPVRYGDIDGNGVVDIADFLLLIDGWGACEADCCLADLDLDGDVGVTDFLLLLANWGP